MMRAAISDREGRQEHKVDWVKGTRRSRGMAITRFTSIELGHSACYEARGILARVEPRTNQSDYYESACLWPAILPRPSHTPGGERLAERVLVNMAANRGTFALIGIERDALAESLAAVIEVLGEMEGEANA